MASGNRPLQFSTKQQAQREDLFERAKYGKITGDEADTEAIRLGLGSLSHGPDPDEFRPESIPQWTLPMAVSWIAYRSNNAVREVWNKYCEECWDWHWRRWRIGTDGEVHEGWFLEQRAFPTLTLLEFMSAFHSIEGDSRPMIMSVSEAREALWVALGESMLPSTGIARNGGGRVPIPPLEWLAMKPLHSDHSDEVGRDGIGMEYADPLLPSGAMRHLWGPPRERQSLPELMRPEGDGYMPVYCAAQWIATEGGEVDFDPKDAARWRAAFDQLLGAVASEKVRVVGLRSGAREQIPGFRFAGCVVDYPHVEATLDLLMSESMYLRSYPYINEERWRKGFDDALVSRKEDFWVQLMVEKGDVQTAWPFTSVELTKTGAPGRPTSMHLVVAELDRLGEEGSLEPSIRQQASVLSDWLAKCHPGHPPLTPKSISNKIGSQFRVLKNAQK
tara:strand:- start:21077 stop:22414 length:1338 start_codon:yes stop_codon:yes gene_type:complete